MANYLYVIAEKWDIGRFATMFRAEECTGADLDETWSALFV